MTCLLFQAQCWLKSVHEELAVPFRYALRGRGQWMLALNAPRRFYYKCSVWAPAGQIKEYYRLPRTTAPKGYSHPR
jgi:hypothetical protein